jgi:hypothetical protein
MRETILRRPSRPSDVRRRAYNPLAVGPSARTNSPFLRLWRRLSSPAPEFVRQVIGGLCLRSTRSVVRPRKAQELPTLRITSRFE